MIKSPIIWYVSGIKIEAGRFYKTGHNIWDFVTRRGIVLALTDEELDSFNRNGEITISNDFIPDHQLFCTKNDAFRAMIENMDEDFCKPEDYIP